MVKILDTFRDADGKPIQPFFAAFMIERGYARGSEPYERDGHNCEFLEWNLDRWAEFERENGHPVNGWFRHLLRDDYRAWLERRCIDHLARNQVEAA